MLKNITDVIPCKNCYCYVLQQELELLNHCRYCPNVQRINSSYNYVCLVCEYHTNHKNNMRGHLQIHTGEKPFKCDECPYKSKNSFDLKKHVAIRHTNEVDSTLMKFTWKKSRIILR